MPKTPGPQDTIQPPLASTASNATASLPSPEQAALQELWLRVFAMTPTRSSISSSTTPSTPSASMPPQGRQKSNPDNIPRKGSQNQLDLQARRKSSQHHLPTRPPRHPHLRAPIARRHKHKTDHLSLSAADLHAGIYDAMRANTPDWWISHYLRANNHNVDNALDDLLKHVYWRRCILPVDVELMPQGEPGALRVLKDKNADPRERKAAEGFLHILDKRICRILPKRDHLGRIMALITVRNHRAGVYPSISYLRYIVWHIEMARMLMGEARGDGILIVDCVDYKVNNMDYRPVKMIIQLMRDVYPQGLGDVILHRAPALIMPVWQLVKRLVSQEYWEHVHFTKDVTDLKNFLPEESIPTEMGGKDDTGWPYEYPNEDDVARGVGSPRDSSAMAHIPNSDSSSSSPLSNRGALLHRHRMEVAQLFEETTREWIDASRSGRDVRGLEKLREKYQSELVKAYWALDPYVRGRGIYDKLGWVEERMRECGVDVDAGKG